MEAFGRVINSCISLMQGGSACDFQNHKDHDVFVEDLIAYSTKFHLHESSTRLVLNIATVLYKWGKVFHLPSAPFVKSYRIFLKGSH